MNTPRRNASRKLTPAATETLGLLRSCWKLETYPHGAVLVLGEARRVASVAAVSQLAKHGFIGVTGYAREHGIQGDAWSLSLAPSHGRSRMPRRVA